MSLSMLGLLASLLVSQTDVEAPSVPPWPDDTPAAVLVPTAGRCVALDGSDLGAGVFMGDRLAGIVNGRLEALSSFPARCQVRINGAVDSALADAAAKEQKRIAQLDHGWPMVAVVGAVAGALILGLLGGFGFGQLAR